FSFTPTVARHVIAPYLEDDLGDEPDSPPARCNRCPGAANQGLSNAHKQPTDRGAVSRDCLRGRDRRRCSAQRRRRRGRRRWRWRRWWSWILDGTRGWWDLHWTIHRACRTVLPFGTAGASQLPVDPPQRDTTQPSTRKLAPE